MIDTEQWAQLQRVFRAAFATSLHFSIASLDATGAPCVTPIGSVLLAEPGHAFFFEVLAQGLARRLGADQRVSVLAVDSGRWLWLRALWRGSFARTPAVRLIGRAAPEARRASPAEISRWRRRLGPVWQLEGSRILWSNLTEVRDLWIERIEPIRLGVLTRSVKQLA
jgi:hypothetical protein